MGGAMAGTEGAQQGRAARRAAAALVAGVLRDHRPLSELSAPLEPLAPGGRATAQRLAALVLRHLDAADAMLAPHLAKAPPAPVLALLRLAVVEHFAAGTPAHAAVNEAVALVRAGRRSGHLAGLANAVLRRALATPPEVWAAQPPQRLPGWLRRRLVAAWGAEAVDAMEAVQARGAMLDLTPRDPAAAAALATRLGAELLPTGSLRLAGGQVSALPGHAEGEFWVQDAAAALPVRLLDVRPGERVLDLCAAPGGKTLQLAAAGARVTALDVSEPRLARLRENLARTGLSAEVVAADALEWVPEAPFDAILLDAPCTATGTIRRHPDLPHVREAASLATLLPLQAALIDRAAGWLRPGGRLVYAVCSLLPEEGEDQARAALARLPGLAVAEVLPEGVPPEWRSPAGGLRTRPDHWAGRGGIDGFYMLCLRCIAPAT
jgi:16S rRNA (cytosine967-C5)-methyltransferase